MVWYALVLNRTNSKEAKERENWSGKERGKEGEGGKERKASKDADGGHRRAIEVLGRLNRGGRGRERDRGGGR